MIIFLGNQDSTERYSKIVKSSAHDPDIVLSCQYPHKIPESLIAKYPCVNIHYGMLPEFSGCNPIYWQILKSDKAAVTLHYVDKDFDTGDIIEEHTVPIGNCTADELYAYLANQGVRLFKKWYEKILEGTAPRKAQNLDHRTFYSKSSIDFGTAKNITHLEDKVVRALHFKGKQYPIIKLGDRQYELRCCNTSL